MEEVKKRERKFQSPKMYRRTPHTDIPGSVRNKQVSQVTLASTSECYCYVSLSRYPKNVTSLYVTHNTNTLLYICTSQVFYGGDVGSRTIDGRTVGGGPPGLT